ncbi:NAD(P)-binding domain-containing protein [Streptomyces nanhaiensis]|uniref:NAD(P)-binding domain-containing protein n=1 Tax=Streptomyces nanhaiensis TaxID=679319 RepID=UPI00399D52BA
MAHRDSALPGVDVLAHPAAAAPREQGTWVVRAEGGREFTARALMAVTGDYGTPHVPDLPGRAEYGGRILHAADYRTPEPFAGQRIVVVGGGNSSIQIAAELGAVADVTLATRRPIGWLPQRPLGKNLHWWLAHTGLDVAPLSRWLHRLPVSVRDNGRWRRPRRAQRGSAGDVHPPRPRGVVWADGSAEVVDTVLQAIGYRPAFPYLTDSGTLDAQGRPVHRSGIATVPGLGFVGLEFQRSFSSKTLRGVDRDAAHVLARLRRQQS